MRDKIFKFIEDIIKAIGLDPIVLIIEKPKGKNELLKVLNVDSNLKCAMNFFETHDKSYNDCIILLGLRKKRTPHDPK